MSVNQVYHFSQKFLTGSDYKESDKFRVELVFYDINMASNLVRF